MKILLRVFLVLLWSVLSSTSNAGDIRVEITGLKNSDGDVHVALFDSPDGFPYSEAILVEEELKIINKEASFIFRNLKEGMYAIAAYHDQNANDEFDQNFLGIPQEDYQFSNDVQVFLVPPSFDEAKFKLLDRLKTITIDFR